MAYHATAETVHAPQFPPMRLLRMGEVVWRTGFKKSYLYLRIRDKSFPPPIHVGVSARFIESEILAVQRAWTLRKTRDEIRQLIADLVAAR